jgi:hypothetical protein
MSKLVVITHKRTNKKIIKPTNKKIDNKVDNINNNIKVINRQMFLNDYQLHNTRFGKSTAWFTLYTLTMKKHDNQKKYVCKYCPIYMNYWDNYISNPNVLTYEDHEFGKRILFNLIGKKYNQRKKSINEIIISLYLNNIQKYDINPCFISVVDHFISDFYVYKNTIIKSMNGDSSKQQFCHIMAPLYENNYNNIKTSIDKNKLLFYFSLYSAFYISNKLFGFVHGDLFTKKLSGIGNLMYTEISCPGITHVCYELKDKYRKYYYLFKLNTPGYYVVPILHDFGRSYIKINNIKINAASIIYNENLYSALNKLRNNDDSVLYNFAKKEHGPKFNKFDMYTFDGIFKIFNRYINNNGLQFYDNENELNNVIKNFKENVKFYKENNIDKVLSPDIYNSFKQFTA